MFHRVSRSVSDFKHSLQFSRAARQPLGIVAQDLDEAGHGAWFGPPDPHKPRIGIGPDGNGVAAEVG